MEICGLFLMANASACFNVSDSGVAAPGCLDVRGLPGVPWACDGACAGAVDTGALCAFTACGKGAVGSPSVVSALAERRANAPAQSIVVSNTATDILSCMFSWSHHSESSKHLLLPKTPAIGGSLVVHHGNQGHSASSRSACSGRPLQEDQCSTRTYSRALAAAARWEKQTAGT